MKTTIPFGKSQGRSGTPPKNRPSKAGHYAQHKLSGKAQPMVTPRASKPPTFQTEVRRNLKSITPQLKGFQRKKLAKASMGMMRNIVGGRYGFPD